MSSAAAKKIVSWLNRYALHIAWTQALVALAGSLFFDEVLGWPPCKLCWYQRIAMFPLVVVLGVGLRRRMRDVDAIALPLAGFGLIVAAYQNLLQYGFVTGFSACDALVPCVTNKVFLGFVTLPLLSLASFIVVIGCLIAYRQRAASGLTETPG